MDKNILDNMSGQELVELIDDQVVGLDDLDNSAVGKIMDFEIDMLCFGSGDMALIRRCAELLDKRNERRELEKNNVVDVINKSLKEHVIITEEQIKKPKAKVIRKKHFVLRKAGVAVAIIAIMIATTVLASAAFGVNIFEYISKIVRSDEGKKIDVDDFTFHNAGEVKQYSSVEEMIEKENLNVMYPTKWPNGITLDSVRIANGTNGTTIVQFHTNDINTTVEIELAVSEFNSSNRDKYISNGIEFTLDNYDTFAASCYYNGNRYFIGAKTRKDLITIIDNLKE